MHARHFYCITSTIQYDNLILHRWGMCICIDIEMHDDILYGHLALEMPAFYPSSWQCFLHYCIAFYCIFLVNAI